MVGRLLAALVILLMTSAVGGASAATRFVPLLQPGDTVGPVPLTDQAGRPFVLSDLHGRAVALSFIYTRCSDARMCPLVSAKFARVQATLGNAPIHLVLVTLDPDFDTPKVLAAYGRAFGQDPRRWTFATGSNDAVDELAARFGIVSRVTAPGTIVHSEAAVIIDPQGRLARIVDGNDWSPDDVLGFARDALGMHDDPLVAFRSWLTAAAEFCGGGRVGLSNVGMLGILATAIAVVGGIFLFAFRSSIRPGRSSHR